MPKYLQDFDYRGYLIRASGIRLLKSESTQLYPSLDQNFQN